MTGTSEPGESGANGASDMSAGEQEPRNSRAAKSAEPVEMLVCVTCRMAEPNGDSAEVAGAAPATDSSSPDGIRPGAILMEALSGIRLPEGVALREVSCMSNCNRGCTVTLRGGPRRWSYVYGNLDPALHLDALLEGAARYRDAEDGLVPWRERPEHFKRNCIARVPPVDLGAADGKA